MWCEVGSLVGSFPSWERENLPPRSPTTTCKRKKVCVYGTVTQTDVRRYRTSVTSYERIPREETCMGLCHYHRTSTTKTGSVTSDEQFSGFGSRRSSRDTRESISGPKSCYPVIVDCDPASTNSTWVLMRILVTYKSE